MRRADPLPAELEGMLAKERNFPPESAELRARAMTRARAALREPRGASVVSFRQRRVLLLVAAALVMGFATVAIADWRGLFRSSVQHPSVAPTEPPENVTRAGAAEPQLPPVLTEAPAEKTAGEAAVGTPERRDTVAVPSRSLSNAGDGDALELGLLQRARAAVASGAFSSALDAIAEHQRRFPRGRLQEEREALRVKALVGLGRNDEARRAAERFRERFPRSVLLPRIEETTRPNP